MRFNLGDKVSWAGVMGKVIKDYGFKDPSAAPLLVEFEADASGAAMHEKKQQHTFMYDGRLHPWHKEPSLKLEN